MIKEFFKKLDTKAGLLHFVCNDRMVAFCHASIPQAFRTSYKKVAFTLAEVLITLGIIGVVAALTLPVLNSKIQEKTFVSRLKKEYSTLAQAHRLVVANTGDFVGNDVGVKDTAAGAQKIFEIYRPYLKVARICGENEKDCFASEYQTLQGTAHSAITTHAKFYKAMLTTGTAIWFWTNGNDNCSSTGICGAIAVDLNGVQKPNKSGVDYFVFNIYSDGVRPAAPNEEHPQWCTFNGAERRNGDFCTAWVIKKGNMDYLRRDISEEW